MNILSAQMIGKKQLVLGQDTGKKYDLNLNAGLVKAGFFVMNDSPLTSI